MTPKNAPSFFLSGQRLCLLFLKIRRGSRKSVEFMTLKTDTFPAWICESECGSHRSKGNISRVGVPLSFAPVRRRYSIFAYQPLTRRSAIWKSAPGSARRRPPRHRQASDHLLVYCAPAPRHRPSERDLKDAICLLTDMVGSGRIVSLNERSVIVWHSEKTESAST